MGAAYSFVSRWQVAASAARCGEELERMLRPGARSWWPGVTVDEAPGTLAAGETIRLAVRSPLGYRLRIVLTVTHWRPGREIAAESEGDLRGDGRIEVEAVGEAAASVVFHWNVVTEVRWMTFASPVLRPVFALAHGWVMRAGERGPRRALAQDS